MQVRSTLRAAGNTHPGLLRDLNEDRFHYDAVRGIFIVIDGVGGQAAGEKAAETALTKIRERLESETGPVEARVREAITGANNEVFRLASLRPEWKGMACVLTIALVDGDDVVVGHVGDTRLYKLRAGRIDKLTKDHSPVGEREDAGDISEADAMRHPRRNEVYRDVGSEAHRATDAGFIDVFRVPFEPDAALLLCSDGLTDLVTAAAIRRTVEEYAGHAYEIVRALIDAANNAGGKDNVTVVYVEGSRFAEGEDTRDVASRRHVPTPPVIVPAAEPSAPAIEPAEPSARWITIALLLLLAVVLAASAYAFRDKWLPPVTQGPLSPVVRTIVVRPGDSIAAALARAEAGMEIIVEPGEYRERLLLKSGIRVRSRVPRGASIRLPGGASESDAALVALDVSDVEVTGFRIVGDAATPLGTGIFAGNSSLTLVDVEVTGAHTAAVEFGTGASGGVIGSDLHDNPGAGMIVRSGAIPRITHNTLARNATSERAAGPMLIEAGARPDIRFNTFLGISADGVIAPAGAERSALAAENWFVAVVQRATPPARAVPGRRGRQ